MFMEFIKTELKIADLSRYNGWKGNLIMSKKFNSQVKIQ